MLYVIDRNYISENYFDGRIKKYISKTQNNFHIFHFEI